MKIQYSDWQQIDLARFDGIQNESINKFGDSFGFLTDDGDLSVSSYSNTSFKGLWGSYAFSVTGNNFTSGSSTINFTSLSFKNTLESLKISGSASYNIYSESMVSGYFSKLEYSNYLGDSAQLTGEFRFDNNDQYINSKVTSFSVTLSGYSLALSGNLTLNTVGDITGGTVNSISFTDNQGRKLQISDIAQDFNYLDALTDNVSNLSNLYNTLNFSGNDTITAGATDDILDGQAGADTLIGGLGNDTYLVDLLSNGKLQDKITEAKNAGTDTLVLRGDISLAKAATIKLVSNLENIDISLTNNSLLNLTGDNANNTLIGNAANNVIDGGKGVDTMIGGAGNDTYVLDNAGDIVTEAFDSGTDLVNIKFTSGSYTLGENVENGLISHAKAFALTGNALNNTLTGGAGANTINGAEGDDNLNGAKGNDTLNGGAGNDSLTGGAGADTFVFSLAGIGSAGTPSIDIVTDFSAKQKDVLDLRDLLPNANEGDLSGLLTFIDVTTNGANTEVRISSTGGFAQGNFDASAEDAHITLTGVNLLAGTDESTLLQTLMTKNQLLID